MKSVSFIIPILLLISCTTTKKMSWGERSSSITGSQFYHQAFSMHWQERDSFAVKEILSGDIPSFLKKFVAIHVSITDSLTGKK